MAVNLLSRVYGLMCKESYSELKQLFSQLKEKLFKLSFSYVQEKDYCSLLENGSWERNILAERQIPSVDKKSNYISLR